MNRAEQRIHIIGIGSDGIAGLTTRARELIQGADAILGSDAVLRIIPEPHGERIALGTDLPEVLSTLTRLLDQGRRAVLLASGDPLFYGVARYVCDRLGKDHFEVLPHVSSMQLAFARIKESWEEAYLTNLATHPLDEVMDRIRGAEVVGLFTTERDDPPHIARRLIERGIDYFRIYVCENLGSPDERVTQGELTEIMTMEFAPLNVVILKRKPDRPDLPASAHTFLRFGNPDDVFAQSRPKTGLITQAEVRCLALAHMGIRSGYIIWDIGAGSGSVAIEAAQLSAPGLVYAIEQDAADYHLILANAEMFGVRNLRAVHGVAPAVFAGLPAPDSAFVGGTGREVCRLVEGTFAHLRVGGRLVVNVASLESLTATYATMKHLSTAVQVLLVNIARGVEQLETVSFNAVNPTFLLSVTKTS